MQRLGRYSEEKDWGANHAALAISNALGLQGYYRLNLARTLMDYGRFPGSTNPDGTEHMHRLAIAPPLAEKLSYDEKAEILNLYDRASVAFQGLCYGRRVKIAVHTYDRFNEAPNEHLRTRRPAVSLLYRSLAYEIKKRMPFGLFDPLYISELGEYTADTRLMARISLALESEGITVGHNHPYNLPEGSVEVRAAVWAFFDYLRERFESEFPSSRNHNAFAGVWRMLLDTNLRDGLSEVYRSYIHMFRTPPMTREQECKITQESYSEVKKFVQENREELVEEYRGHPKRIDAFALEIRKDLAWDESVGQPNTIFLKTVGALVAKATLDHLRIDLKISLD